MEADSTQAMKAYKSVDVETRVLAASPQQLIMMLFDGALASLKQAKTHIANRNIAAKGAAISKAINIIDEGLKASLDEKAGGQLATDLKALYEYMTLRLMAANLKSDPAIIDEVGRLLYEVASAWRQIAQVPTTADAPAAANPMAAALAKAGSEPQPAARSAMSYGKA